MVIWGDVEYEVLFRFAAPQMRCPLCLREEIVRALNHNGSARFASQKLNEGFNRFRSFLELLVFDRPQINGVV